MGTMSAMTYEKSPRYRKFNNKRFRLFSNSDSMEEAKDLASCLAEGDYSECGYIMVNRNNIYKNGRTKAIAGPSFHTRVTSDRYSGGDLWVRLKKNAPIRSV